MRSARRASVSPSPRASASDSSLDPHLRATEALARFGVGFVEVGPFAITPAPGARVDRDDDRQSLLFDDTPEQLTLDAAADRLAGLRARDVPILVRLDAADLAGVDATVARLAPLASAFTVTARGEPWTAARWRDLGARVAAAAGAEARPLLVVADGAVPAGAGRHAIGRAGRDTARATVGALRASLGPDVAIIAGGGVHEPQDARDVLDAGADFVLIDSGMVFAGPGLPKRVNDALSATDTPSSSGETPDEKPSRIAEMSWVWTLLMGVGMLVGSVIALGIAATRVLLPYDEQFVGLSRHELAAVNARLLPFLTHDRVILAGAMIAIGVLYAGLSWFGVRRGRHWAQVAIVVSAVVGFASFFLFLGFGYFDPFHALVTAILFQLLLMGVHGRLGPPRDLPPPMLVEDRAWRAGLWGQLGLVVQGAGFIGAGLMIAAIGATHVFVHEDLEFLGTTHAALLATKPHLVPLVAHDRATLGGMLIVSGILILLISLWGFRQGERWLWWTLLVAGIPGYVGAIAVHYAVGYESTFHLAPAFLGLGLFAAALAAAWPTLCRR